MLRKPCASLRAHSLEGWPLCATLPTLSLKPVKRFPTMRRYAPARGSRSRIRSRRTRYATGLPADDAAPRRNHRRADRRSAASRARLCGRRVPAHERGRAGGRRDDAARSDRASRGVRVRPLSDLKTAEIGTFHVDDVAVSVNDFRNLPMPNFVGSQFATGQLSRFAVGLQVGRPLIVNEHFAVFASAMSAARVALLRAESAQVAALLESSPTIAGSPVFDSDNTTTGALSVSVLEEASAMLRGLTVGEGLVGARPKWLLVHPSLEMTAATIIEAIGQRLSLAVLPFLATEDSSTSRRIRSKSRRSFACGSVRPIGRPSRRGRSRTRTPSALARRVSLGIRARGAEHRSRHGILEALARTVGPDTRQSPPLLLRGGRKSERLLARRCGRRSSPWRRAFFSRTSRATLAGERLPPTTSLRYVRRAGPSGGFEVRVIGTTMFR